MQNKLRIFIADDDLEMLRVMTMVLRDDGHEVETFTSGAELWRGIVASMKSVDPVQLVISDVRMPEFTGLDVSAGIQAAFFSVPVLLISGFADEDVRSEAGRAGVRGVLAKPFSLDAFKAAVDQVLVH